MADKQPANKEAANAQSTEAALQPFNLATMSGVFPGSRTQIFQRARVVPVAASAPQHAWIQLLWRDEHDATKPDRCSVFLTTPGSATPATALLELSAPEPSHFHQQLAQALQEVGWQLASCGTCHHWHAGQPRERATPAPFFPAGRCHWKSADTATPQLLRQQSPLALQCPHWQSAADQPTKSEPMSSEEAMVSPVMPRSGESAAIRLAWWQRLWRTVRRKVQRQPATGITQQRDWATLLEERSGVGAGTEPCFVCQGRIANLGALTVATPEDDKQTFSLWRCRSCYTLYLNNWIDRWERLDNLETEESYYRIAPAEAVALLDILYARAGGEHPGRRHERGAERQRVLAFMATRQPLSHQIRQGR